MNSKSLEAAARALYEQNPIQDSDGNVIPWDALKEYDDWSYDGVHQFAKAAIEAYLSAEKSRGYAMMPAKPTPEMVNAAGEAARKANPAMKGDDFKAVAWDARHIYRAMFDAAPNGGEET